MKRPLLVCLIFFLSTCFSEGAGASEDNTVPFEMLAHLIIVTGKINDSPDDYTFIVDTGALTFIDINVVRDLELKQKGMMAKINSLDLSGFRIDNIFCFTTFDFQDFKRLSTPVHGIIGSNLLERFKVIIDFESSEVTFSGDTTSLAPVENGLFLTFRNHPVNYAPLVNFKIGQKIIEGMIDTGQPYPVVLPLDSFEEYGESEVADFIKSKGLMEEWPNTAADFNYLARLKHIEFEDLKIDNVICLFGELPRPLSMPLIGNDFLSQFKLIINYPGDEMMMIPYHDVHLENDWYSIGLWPDISDKNEIFVKGVWENSPADAAGIEIGDIIVSFDSEKVTQENLIELIDMLNDDDTEAITFEVRNEGGARKVTIKKAMLFRSAD